jgi:cell wall-associated NlpC family hydrolase
MIPPRLPVLDPLDRRLNVIGPGIAEKRLEGLVAASAFVDGDPARIVAPVAGLRREPRPDCGLDHELLMGEEVLVFDAGEGWSLVKSRGDGYVGWTPSQGVGAVGAASTHVVTAPRTFLYPGPDLKLPGATALSMGSRIAVAGETVTRGTRYLTLAGGGAVFAGHVASLPLAAGDYVSIAERLLATPYLWGGASAIGIDCSGLVQLSMRMAGMAALRDSDMQAATLGEPVDTGSGPGPGKRDLRRGDLIFWRGHVAIAQGEGRLIHANGYTMDVASEAVDVALERIAAMFEQPIGVRRPGAVKPR